MSCRGHTAAVVYMGPHARRIVAELQDKVWAASCPLLSIFPLTVIVKREGIGPLAYKLHANRGFYVLFTAESSAVKQCLAHDRHSINIK